jgi:hypothetical protein
LYLLSELTPRKTELYECIWNTECALCKLKNKHKEKKLKKLCCVDSDPVMENLLSSLTVEAASSLAAIIRNSRQKPKCRRWNLEDKVLALFLLKHSPKSYILFQALLPSHLDKPCNVFILYRHQCSCVWYTKTLQKISDKDSFCLMFDGMSIRENLHFNQKFDCTGVFKILEGRIGHEHCKSCSSFRDTLPA